MPGTRSGHACSSESKWLFITAPRPPHELTSGHLPRSGARQGGAARAPLMATYLALCRHCALSTSLKVPSPFRDSSRYSAPPRRQQPGWGQSRRRRASSSGAHCASAQACEGAALVSCAPCSSIVAGAATQGRGAASATPGAALRPSAAVAAGAQHMRSGAGGRCWRARAGRVNAAAVMLERSRGYLGLGLWGPVHLGEAWLDDARPSP